MFFWWFLGGFMVVSWLFNGGFTVCLVTLFFLGICLSFLLFFLGGGFFMMLFDYYITKRNYGKTIGKWWFNGI